MRHFRFIEQAVFAVVIISIPGIANLSHAQADTETIRKEFLAAAYNFKELRGKQNKKPEDFKESWDTLARLLTHSDEMPRARAFRQEVMHYQAICAREMHDWEGSIKVLKVLIEEFPGHPNTEQRKKWIPILEDRIRQENQKSSDSKMVNATPDYLKVVMEKLGSLYRSRSNDKNAYTKVLQELENMYPEIDSQNIEARALVLGAKGSTYMNVFKDDKSAMQEFQRIVNDMPGSDHAKRAESIIQQLRTRSSLVHGAEFPEFSFTDLGGNDVSLKEFRGKVVLLDFWATWCQPCIYELPNVQAAYNAFHDDGFEIIGISLDMSRPFLDNFLEKHKITWTQQFDGKGWDNQIAKKFGINSIPATFLITSDGQIMARNLRGPILLFAVAKLLNLDPSALPDSALMDLKKARAGNRKYQKNEVPMLGEKRLSQSLKEANLQFTEEMTRNGRSPEDGAKYAVSTGWNSYAMGDPSTAIMRFNQAWLLDENNREALWGFAVISLMRGELEDALRFYKEAIDNGDPDPSLEWEYSYAQEIKKRI